MEENIATEKKQSNKTKGHPVKTRFYAIVGLALLGFFYWQFLDAQHAIKDVIDYKIAADRAAGSSWAPFESTDPNWAKANRKLETAVTYAEWADNRAFGYGKNWVSRAVFLAFYYKCPCLIPSEYGSLSSLATWYDWFQSISTLSGFFALLYLYVMLIIGGRLMKVLFAGSSKEHETLTALVVEPVGGVLGAFLFRLAIGVIHGLCLWLFGDGAINWFLWRAVPWVAVLILLLPGILLLPIHAIFFWIQGLIG